MILCKYCDEEGLDIFRNRRLKVSSIYEFNDPFELHFNFNNDININNIATFYKNKDLLQTLYKRKKRSESLVDFENAYKTKIFNDDDVEYFKSQMQSDSFKEAIKAFKNHLNANNKILSLIDINRIEAGQDILMWSHYSDGHRGIRIHFDIDKFEFVKNEDTPTKITYVVDPAKISLFICATADPNGEDFRKIVDSVMFCKGKFWEYENEYRCYISNGKVKSDTKTIGTIEKTFYYVPLDLKSIIMIDIGCNCSQLGEIRDLLNDNIFKHVELREVRINKSKYELEYIKVER